VSESWDAVQLVESFFPKRVSVGLDFEYDMNRKWNQQQILGMGVQQELRDFQL
jgi:hypothetical protein